MTPVPIEKKTPERPEVRVEFGTGLRDRLRRAGWWLPHQPVC